MGILDEAIREHLELKRQHGAAEGELQKLEDEAFGPPERPGAPETVAEAPTTIAPAEFAEGPPVEPAESPDAAEAPEFAEAAEAPLEAPEPAEEEHPAVEQPVVGGDEDDAGIVAIETEEHPPPEPPAEAEAPAEPLEPLVAEQPTELHDPEGQPAAEPEYEGGDEVEAPEEEVEDEFFSEQSLSDELDQALEGVEPEGEAPVPPTPEVDEPEPEPAAGDEAAPDEGGEGAPEDEVEQESEDVLEETPEFLQDTPEHDRLWFEQKPPKDFDFDD
jgi:hypothetical protein